LLSILFIYKCLPKINKYEKSSFISVVLTSVISCTKEFDDSLEPPVNSHRIKREVHYKNNIESYTGTYTYGGEKLMVVLSDLKHEGQSKWDITYVENKIIRVQSFKSVDSWDWLTLSKKEFKIMDNRVTEILEYNFRNGIWNLSTKKSYQYDNELISYQFSYYGSNNYSHHEKGEFFYKNKKLVEFKDYYKDDANNWIQSGKWIYTYTEKNIEKIEIYNIGDGSGKLGAEINYFFSQDKISEIIWKKLDSKKDIWEIDFTFEYKYDINGYLIEEIQNSGIRKTIYEYEDGSGNASFFTVDDFHNAIPMPKLKSASIKSLALPEFNFLGNINSQDIFLF
jgi:hypothetical protein